MRLYSDLAPWFHLLTHPSDYSDEADLVVRIVEATVGPEAETLLELGSGGGNNASHLKRRFRCTLSDVSQEMLDLSETVNPECEHVQGDMRTLRLGRDFDVVFVHDAVMYMTSEHDLGAAIRTAAVHVRPGGVAILVPDTTAERFAPATEHGGHDGEDGRSLRYLEWTTDPDPTDSTFEADFVVCLREPGAPLRIEHDHHVLGVFPDATWLRLLAAGGLEPLALEVDDPYAGEHVVYVARRPAA